MDLMDLTVVVACKDRKRNVELCMASIAPVKPRPKVILVDFGSAEPLEYLANRYVNTTVIRVDRETEMFHKARALNIGIRATKTANCCLTDADQIFEPNFFNVVIEERKKDKVFVMCETFFLDTLPASVTPFSISPAVYQSLLTAAKGGSRIPLGAGCCNAVDTAWLKSVRGLDERYRGWGFEDKDLDIRAKKSGYTMVTIKNKTSMVHLPHGRDAKYFNKVLRERNERLYALSENGTSDIVANKSGWGEL